MATVVNMPRLGLNEQENMLGEWYVQEGDAVNKGDKLFSIETDKSSMEIYAEDTGIVLKRFYDEYDVIPVMTPVCIIGEQGEDISGVRPSKASNEYVNPEPRENPIQNKGDFLSSANVPGQISQKDDGAVIASPRARRLADANGVDIGEVYASGAEGRIVEQDVINYYKNILHEPTQTATLSPKPADKLNKLSSSVRIEKTSNMRRTIAGNIMRSMNSTAQTTQHMRYNASKLLNYRESLKTGSSMKKNITLNDIISYVTVKTLVDFDYMNAHMLSVEEIMTYDVVNLGCAVDTSKGLLVPNVKNSQDMSLQEFSIALKAVINRAKNGKISLDEMSEGTFTVSNLGSYGVTYFTPILNSPQVGILGIGTIDYTIKNTPEGMLYHPSGYLSLTYDHRAMDGVPAAEFLKALCKTLENIETE